MTDKELDIIGQIIFTIRNTKSLRKMPHEELAAWVSRQLQLTLGIYTCPIGAVWLHKCSEEQYEKHQKR